MQSSPLLRALALDMLTDLRQWPHLDKEKLFADGIAFYRWQLPNASKPENLEVYQTEFEMHHGTLMHGLPLCVQEAAFITWFVENGFHRLPRLEKFDPASGDEYARLLAARFSAPCFHLPTTSGSDTYMVQWLFWSDSRPQDQPAPTREQLFRWGRDLAQLLPANCELNHDALIGHCASFFSWCMSGDYSWERLCYYQADFVRLFPELANEKIETDEWDAHFITWFVGCVLDGLTWTDERAS